MTDTLTYQYALASDLVKQNGREELRLAKFSELDKQQAPCFFWGRLIKPYLTARCLINLSNVVRSSFNLSPFQLALLKDPIVTAGNEMIRFEGFSHCASVYARVDILPDGHEGEFPAAGTTNVDFNPPMIAALGGIRKSEKVVLSVGQKEVGIHKEGESTTERKVPLPTKWIKGLTTVQLFLADSEEVARLNRIQAIQLFRTIPKGNPKTDYYLSMRTHRPSFSPVKQQAGICIGGLHRLRLLEQLVPLADELRIFAHKNMQSTSWQLYFGPIRFSLSLSRENWRGFSGEGAVLESLIADVPEALITRFDQLSYANQVFNPTLLAIEQDINLGKIDQLAARLSAMGMLGYDLDENQFFYRRLPFKLHRILSLNPRMKNADKLLAEGKVEIVRQADELVEALVQGSGVIHTVLLEAGRSRCTCTWFARHQGERGMCKHILAVKKRVDEQS